MKRYITFAGDFYDDPIGGANHLRGFYDDLFEAINVGKNAQNYWWAVIDCEAEDEVASGVCDDPWTPDQSFADIVNSALPELATETPLVRKLKLAVSKRESEGGTIRQWRDEDMRLQIEHIPADGMTGKPKR